MCVFCISLFGWTLDETNARTAVQKARGSWVRSKIFKLTKGSDFGICLLLFCLHYFVWQTATALLKQGIWTRLLCCLAYLGKTEVASLLQESDWEEDPLSCFHMSLKIPSAAVCLWRNTIWERFLENNIKWKLNWLATSCYKEGFIGYSVRGASNFHSVAAASIEQRF